MSSFHFLSISLHPAKISFSGLYGIFVHNSIPEVYSLSVQFSSSDENFVKIRTYFKLFRYI